ncbi:MAG: DUF481 domain-containing protein [Xenococcaceae cyanobacterium MO_234.B1]|nr:DUF481 domain-containing protein [Xenococcaceae cyanobacterium MO_234.B1]
MLPINRKLSPIILVILGFWLSVFNSAMAASKDTQEVIQIKNLPPKTAPEIVKSSIAQIIPTEARDSSKSREEISESESEIKSESILSQALEMANSIKDPQRQATVLSDVALQYAAIGQISKAIVILDQALETAQTIEDTPTQISVTGSIAVKYDPIGQGERAAEILSESLAAIKALEDAEIQASLFTEIALKYSQIGRSEQARDLLARSQQAVAKAAVPVPNFPFQPTPLAGGLTVGTRVFSGLTSENSLDINVNLEQQLPVDSFDIDLSFRTDFDSDRTTDQRQNRYFGSATYLHHFDPRWQYAVRTIFLRDEDENIFADWGFYTGPGINLMRKSPQRTLDFFLGLGAEYEDLLGNSNDFDFPVIPVGLVYRDLYFGVLQFSQELLYTFPTSDSGDNRLLSRTRLSIPITKRWSLSSLINYIYRGIPPTDKPGSELNFTTGLTFSFD